MTGISRKSGGLKRRKRVRRRLRRNILVHEEHGEEGFGLISETGKKALTVKSWILAGLK